jgi:hypothetical protein
MQSSAYYRELTALAFTPGEGSFHSP